MRFNVIINDKKKYVLMKHNMEYPAFNHWKYFSFVRFKSFSEDDV